jgi:hypothetical protein
MRDNVSKVGTVVTALAALPVNKINITGQTVSLLNYNAATLYIPAGTWTDGTHTFTIQESPDGTTWNTVANGDLVAWQATSATVTTAVKQPDGSGSGLITGRSQPAAISSAATAVNQRIGYIGAQPNVRVNVVVTGAPVTGAAYDAVWVLGEPRDFVAPV